MSNKSAVILAGIAVVVMAGLAFGLARKRDEPRLPAQDRQPATATEVPEVPAAAVPPAGPDDLEAAAAMHRFCDTKQIITSATIAYYQILQWNAVAMQYAKMTGDDRSRASRIPPGVQETIDQLPLDSLPQEVNRIKDDRLVPPEDRRKFAEVWTLYGDVKSLVENPRTYSYSKYDELKRRFERIVENKSATVDDSAKSRVARSSDNAETDAFGRDVKSRIAAAQERLTMAENYQNELRRVQDDAKQTRKRLEEKRLDLERLVNNQQFERWLQGQPPRLLGEALVKRSGTQRTAAQHAFRDENVQLAEQLFWDAAEAALRASNINETHQGGEVAIRLVIEEYGRCVGLEHDLHVFVRQVNNRRFDLWLLGQTPREQGEALVRRCDQLLTAAERFFRYREGNTQYGEDLLWDAAEAASRASNIDETQRIGEFTIKRVKEARCVLMKGKVP